MILLLIFILLNLNANEGSYTVADNDYLIAIKEIVSEPSIENDFLLCNNKDTLQIFVEQRDVNKADSTYQMDSTCFVLLKRDSFQYDIKLNAFKSTDNSDYLNIIFNVSDSRRRLTRYVGYNAVMVFVNLNNQTGTLILQGEITNDVSEDGAAFGARI